MSNFTFTPRRNNYGKSPFFSHRHKPHTIARTRSVMRTVLLALLSVASCLGHKLQLRYFDARGAAEISRVLLALGGIDFEDHRYTIERKDGGGFSTPEFSTDKESGALLANLNRAPILRLEDSGHVIGQSRAIERYVASQAGLMGATPYEAAIIDSIAEHVRDVKDAQARKGFSAFARDKSEEEKAQAKVEWYETEMPAWLQKIEACLEPCVRGDAQLCRCVHLGLAA
jgi:glutathione S-transferase